MVHFSTLFTNPDQFIHLILHYSIVAMYSHVKRGGRNNSCQKKKNSYDV